MSTVDSSEVVQSGFGEISKRRAAELARAARPAKQVTARSRISAQKTKKGRPKPFGPTPERLAKGDVVAPRSFDAPYRALAPSEQMRDARDIFQRPISKLTPAAVEQLRKEGKLDHDPCVNEAMYQAAEKLRRHFDGCLIGVKAQDLNRVIGRPNEDPTAEEAWVYHYDTFSTACRLMGWSPDAPFRGSGRIVVAVICYEMTIRDAAEAHLPPLNQNAKQGIALDRLRSGLFALAIHWRMIRG